MVAGSPVAQYPHTHTLVYKYKATFKREEEPHLFGLSRLSAEEEAAEPVPPHQTENSNKKGRRSLGGGGRGE